jgi:hypothetical protein
MWNNGANRLKVSEIALMVALLDIIDRMASEWWKEYRKSYYSILSGTNLVLSGEVEEYKELGMFVFLPGCKPGVFHIGSKNVVRHNTYAMGYTEQSIYKSLIIDLYVQYLWVGGCHRSVIWRPCTTYECTETVLFGKISRATYTKYSKIADSHHSDYDNCGLLICDSCNLIASYHHSRRTSKEGKMRLYGFLDRWMKSSEWNGDNILQI